VALYFPASFFFKERIEMEEETSYDLDLKVWTLIGDLHHKMFWLRQKELSQYNITARQLLVLRVIESLGAKATISTIAKAVDRKIDVISRQTSMLEKDGFIKRTKDKPRSRVLTFKLNEKSLGLLKIAKQSEGMSEVLSVLTREERQQLDVVLNRLSIKLNEYTSKQIKDWLP
jgi:DNA-binding MarR family transcriptional regulator